MTELTPSQAQQATRALVADLGRVQHGKALGLNEKGELIGEGLKSSFRGKVVDALVRAGIAKQGNLGGRLAIGLVGKENFDLLLTARKNPGSLERSTVQNAIAVFEGIQKRAAGSDFIQQSAVVDRVYSSVSGNTPLSKLTRQGSPQGGKFHELHDALHNEVFPQRRAQRQATLDRVASGQPTDAMAKAYPDELRAAYRLIENRDVAQGDQELGDKQLDPIKQIKTAGRGGKAVARATDIALEFNRAASLIRGNAAAGEDPAAKVDAFRDEYLALIHDAFERRDVEDGQRLRIGGLTSAPIKEDGHSADVVLRERKSGGKSPQWLRFEGEDMRSFAVRQGMQSEKMERPAFPGVDPIQLSDIAARAEDTLEEISDLYEDAYEANNFPQIDQFAKDLTAIIRSRDTSGDEQAQAADLALKMLDTLTQPRSPQDASANARASVSGSLPATLELLDGLRSQARRDPDVKLQLLAKGGNIRQMAETDLARAKDMSANPEKHADYFAAFEEAHVMDVWVDQASHKEGHEGDQGARQASTPAGLEAASARAEALREIAVVEGQANKVLDKLNAL